MKIFFRVLIYLSLIFLVIYLYKFDYFEVKDLNLDITYLIPGTIFLWAGFFMSTISWWKALKIHNIRVSTKHAVISHGLSAFAKYIPGKIWVILGRASFISVGQHSMSNASYISLKEQLIYVWMGLILGIGPLLYFYPLNSFVILVVLLSIFFTFFLYSRRFHEFTLHILSRIIRKKLEVPIVSFRDVTPLILFVLFYWILWMLAFYFFVLSFHINFSIAVIFCWPLSISLGVLALITPGGIGVREGIMTGFMVLTGIAIEQATTIAVISRLWFITGEIFIFLLSFFLNRFSFKAVDS